MCISKKLWQSCIICGKGIKELKSDYGGCGVYFTNVLKKHLEKDHNISVNEYFVNYCKLVPPICPCKICNKPLDIVISGSVFRWRKIACGRNNGVIKWSEEAKKTRKGKNNPMHGKPSWNKGLKKENNASLLTVSQKLSSRKISDKTKHKMSKSAKVRKIHGHTGRKHSKETRDKLRIITLNRIKNGSFKQTKTVPHIIMSKYLSELEIEYKEEYIVDNWCFDFYLVKEDIFLEVDGDYWHSNPKTYPNGPITKTQKINYYRDSKKNKYCKEHDIKLLRFWECDILSNEQLIKEKLWKLKK
jgi:very-short-patch-repair endonuclease